MRFLRTLQKKQSEKPFVLETDSDLAVSDMLIEPGINRPPGPLAGEDLRIGNGSGQFFDHPERAIAALEPAPAANGLAPAVARGSGIDFPSIGVAEESVNQHIVAITHPRSGYCEEYRSLRTHILLESQKQRMQSIVVVSVGPSEGKSVTALNLAWLLAQTDGVSALLIDSDLRRPSLAAYLGMDDRPGLSEVLAGRTTLTDSIVHLAPVGLHLLPGGAPRNDVAELISGPKFSEILKESRRMFDYVIIDAPPLGIFTDATVLINVADGALLVVRANQTRFRDIDRVLDTLPRERILGTILNQAEDKLVDDSYYNYGIYDIG